MKLCETEQGYVCFYWDIDFGDLDSFWTPESQKEEPFKSLSHEKSFIWISCLIGFQTQTSINPQNMWVWVGGMLSQGPVSAEDFPFAISMAVLFSQLRWGAISFPAFENEE